MDVDRYNVNENLEMLCVTDMTFVPFKIEYFFSVRIELLFVSIKSGRGASFLMIMIKEDRV